VSTDRQFPRAFGILLAMMLTNPVAAIAQSCETLPVDNSPLSYRFRANVPRCEGMYRSPVSGDRGMALVSLTFGKVTYDTRRDQYLEIKLAVEPAEKMLIRAVGVPERLYYRLDVELGPGRSAFRLPLGDVVAPEKILPEQFGIYGVKTLPGGQNAFLPVYAQGSSAAAQAEVIAVVRPGADVSDVQWRRYARGVPVTAWAPVVGASGLVPEGTRLEIVLGKDMPPQMTLEVSFLSQGIGRADRFVLLAR
jgi:hypothetical protein